MKNNFVNFRPATLHIQKGNWEISYYVEHPQTNKLVRKRIKLNHIQSKTSRRQYAYQLIAELNKKLADGWNPYIEQEAPKAFHLLKDAFDAFFMSKKKELRKSSYSSYYNKAARFLKWVSKKHDIDTLYIYTVDINLARGFMKNLYLHKTIGGRSFNNFRADMVAFWNWFIENGYAKTNVFTPIRKKKIDKKIRKIIDEKSLNNIFKYLEEENIYFYAVCLLSYSALLRGAETLKLLPTDFILDQNILVVRAEVSKNGRRRIVTIPKRLKVALERIKINEMPAKNYIFSDLFQNGKRQMTSRAISAKWGRLRDKIEIPDFYQFYSLKDTGIVAMLKAGVPPHVVRDQAGHTDLSTTNKYIQTYITEAFDVILDKMD